VGTNTKVKSDVSPSPIAAGGSATLEPPLSTPPAGMGFRTPTPEVEPEFGGDGGSGIRAPPGGDDGGGGGWGDDYFQWWENNNPFSRCVSPELGPVKQGWVDGARWSDSTAHWLCDPSHCSPPPSISPPPVHPTGALLQTKTHSQQQG